MRLILVMCLLLSSSSAFALTIKSGETIQSSNKASTNVTVSKIIDGNCKLDLPVPNETKPVNFDISGFLHKEGFDLPDYASFAFGEPYERGINSQPAPEIKAVADFNNDGIDDLVIDYYETLVPPLILYGTPQGTFTKAQVDEKAARRHIRNGAVADFNNDGLLDFAGFTTGDPGERWKAEGYSLRGNFVPRGQEDLLLINSPTGFINVEIPEVRANDWNHGGDAGDIDNDGLIDILPLSEGERERTVPLRNLGDNKFLLGSSEYSSEVSYYLTADLDTGDFNNDGFLDIAVAMTPNNNRTPDNMEKLGAVRVVYGDGDFDFRDNKKLKFGTSWVTSEDMNTWLSQAKEQVQAGSGHKAGEFMTGTSHIETMDLDGDGNDDLLLGHWISTTGLWKTAGFTAYLSKSDCFVDATQALFPNQITNRNLNEKSAVNYTHNFHFHDLNNDGLDDLILQSDGFEYEWYRNDPNAGHPYIFINQGGYWLPVRAADVERWVAVDDIVPGDFNGDEIIDLAYIRRNEPTVSLEVSLGEMSLKRQASRYDWSKDIYSGEYNLMWSVENANDPGVWEAGAIDRVYLSEGKGTYLQAAKKGIPGTESQRSKLTMRYLGDTGDIEIEGDLGLFEEKPYYLTTIKGNLQDDDLTSYWREGDRIKVKLEKIDRVQKVSTHSLHLSWYIQMMGDENPVLEAEDRYFLEKSGDSKASSLKVIDAEFNHLTSDAGNHGRENLQLTINDDMTFTLKGQMEVFEGEFAQIGLQSELESGERTFFFGPGDSLILKWEHLVD